MNPLVSIIVPVYNIKDYVRACFDSIKNQTYKNIEIIVVDDGSTDGSEKICNDFKEEDKRVKVFRIENSGLSGARNFGLKKAKGEYITFVDGDDSVEKKYIEYLLNLINEYSTDMSICSFKTKTESTEKKFAKQGTKEQVFDTKTCLEKMLKEEGFNVSACGKLFPKHLFENIEFPLEKLHEDVGTTYKLILKCKKIAFGPKPNYIYFQRKTSITHHFSKKKLDLIKLTDEMCEEIDEKFPDLKDVTNLRRMHARFSILRQLPKTETKLVEEMSNYLKSHKNFILKNKEAGNRDKLAMFSLLLGTNFFRASWKIYETFFR